MDAVHMDAARATITHMGAIPAGWYPDPSGQGTRYWTGTEWTGPLNTKPTPPTAKRSSARIGWIVGGSIALVVAIVVGIDLATTPWPQDEPFPSGISETDHGFLQAMREHGITDDSGEQHQITAAHSVCNQLGMGQTVEGLSAHYSLTNSNLSDDDMHFFIRTAAAAYCPERL